MSCFDASITFEKIYKLYDIKKINLFTFLSFVIILSCKKTSTRSIQEVRADYATQVQSSLKDSLSDIDYASLDFSHSQQTQVDSENIHFFRIPILGKDLNYDFLLVKTDIAGIIQHGSFIHIIKTDTSTYSFNGWFSYHSLKNNLSTTLEISNGFIIKRKQMVMTLITKAPDPTDYDLPGVVVITGGGGLSTSDYFSLSSMMNTTIIGYSGGTSGGTSAYYTPTKITNTDADVIKIDLEYPEKVPGIDIRAFLKCFDLISDANSNCYITIASDVPVNSHPSMLLNGVASPGHSFIILSKQDQWGNTIEQTFGFYPSTGYTSLLNTSVPSKIVNNTLHEYNAKYTISITPDQLHQAIYTTQIMSNNYYNLSSFNCTDFALAIFNAAGGNLSIPQIQIPWFPNNTSGSTGSNTPQGLYSQLNSMVNDYDGIFISNSGSNIGYSHGPCN